MKGQGKGTHPNSKKALQLTQWKVGESGNPKGKPKGAMSLREHMKKFLDLNIQVKMPNGSIQDQTIMDSIILTLLSQAQKGNIIAIKEVLERNFGKEAEKIEVISHEDALKALDD